MERETAIATMKATRGKDANFHDGTFTNWAKEWSYEHRVPAGAGETVGVALFDVNPWDEFTRNADQSPLPPESVSDAQNDEQQGD